MAEITSENRIFDISDLNRFQIGDHVIVDSSAENDRFEGVIIGIELRRVHGSNRLESSITLLHDGYITDEFKPIDCRKVSPSHVSKLMGRLASALEDILPWAEDKWANPDAISEIVNARAVLKEAQAGDETPPPQTNVLPVSANVEDHNTAFDRANEALGGAFMAGFREGWIYAEIDADGDRYKEMAEEYALAVDSAPQEAWDAHRAEFFAMLPLSTILEGK